VGGSLEWMLVEERRGEFVYIYTNYGFAYSTV
jgi:hypothetical protein